MLSKLVDKEEDTKENSKLQLSSEQLLRKENFQLKVMIAKLKQQLADRDSRLLNIQLQQESMLLDKELSEGWNK